LNSVLKNEYIYRKLLPDIDITQFSLEELILLEHTSPIFDKIRLKNAQQMLSCEGVIATLFYKINSNTILQSNFLPKTFYNHFLLSPIPKNMKPQDIFTPFENVILKTFWVWSKMSDTTESEPVVFIDFIKKWCQFFPEDREELLKLFILTTIGKAITNELGNIYETMAYYGMVGSQKFRELTGAFRESFDRLKEKVLTDEFEIDANIGPQIWIRNEDFYIPTCLWTKEDKRPLAINLNTASEFDLATFPNISLKKAKEIIRERDKLGYFKSLEEAEQCGFEM